MSTFSLSTWLAKLVQECQQLLFSTAPRPWHRPSLASLAQQDEDTLPLWVRESSVAMKYLRLLGPLDWDSFPEPANKHFWPGAMPIPHRVFAAAFLVAIDQNLAYSSKLRDYLVEHPALVWVLGFPLAPSSQFSWGFDVHASLPTHRHMSRVLRAFPNADLQFLLDETVRLLQAELSTEVNSFGQAISLDTKHILAWVRENNHKDYVTDRYDKTKQPAGDPHCRLGCKRKRNQRKAAQTPPTPLTNPQPASSTEGGEWHWGYASGIVATKVRDWAEIVLAELTQPFNQSDVSYFFPLMAATERRLGFRPKFGAFDAAYDALCAQSRAL
jgi:hypothetical protein